MSNFNNSKKEYENFEEVPQAQPPLSRHVSNSNAEEFAMDTDTADDFCVEDDEQPVPKNPPSVRNTSMALSQAWTYGQTMQTSVFGQDREVEQIYTNKSNVSHGGSVYINVGSTKKIPSNVTSFPDVQPIISIADLTPFGKDEDLFAALDKSSVDLFVVRNQNQRGWSDIPLAITNFESPLNAEETDSLFTKFLREKNVVCDVVVPGMFYKCYHSEDFSSVSIHVKLYFHAGKNPTMEFRRLQGSPEIFFNIYGSFRNLILNENNPVSMCPPPCDMISEKMLMSKDEEEAAVASLVQWLKSSPTDAIKVVSQVAMEKDKDTQIIMCNEVYNVLHKQKDLTVLMAQTLGFINVIQGGHCLLDEPHKILILSKLRIKLQASVDAPNIPESVKQRAQRFIDGEINSV
jgi:hypothetical protein